MRIWHQAVFFGLMGWYLMLPPARQQNGIPWPDSKAAVSDWTIAKSFDTAESCEAELDHERKGFKKTYSKISHKNPEVEFWARFYVAAAGEATCIATDDPRLKEPMDRTKPDMRPSGTQ
jgi:hypothetical protein